jgi:two-component sensor histidine kinase
MVESPTSCGPPDFGRTREAEIAFEQLRHLTRNGLQRVISSVHGVPGLRTTEEGRRLADRIEQVICASAAVSDVLFGMTREPPPMAERLQSLCDALLDLFADPDQQIDYAVTTAGDCPSCYRHTVVRAANELVGNAIKHGMQTRRTGFIGIDLISEENGRTTLRVTDNGVGFVPGSGGTGQGLKLVQAFADARGGGVRITGGAMTTAKLVLPGMRATSPSSGSEIRRAQPCRPGLRRRAAMFSDGVLIGLMIVVLFVSMTAIDVLTLSFPPLRSICVASLLVAGSACGSNRGEHGP